MSVDLLHTCFGFFVTALASVMILVTKSRHAAFTLDSLVGPQKVHTRQAPRLGGVALFIGMLGVTFVDSSDDRLLLLSVASLLPVFIFGVIEDVSKNVSPRLRLMASLATGIVFLVAFDLHLSRTGFVASDKWLTVVPLAMALTVLAIATLVNAMNIIDGVNGLSIGTSLFIMLGISLTAGSVNDWELMRFAVLISACLCGVLVFNFPHGRIFMGDAGAYVMGGVVAFAAILVSERNTDVSPFFSLLLITYPFYELMRTIVRRIRTTDADMMAPDLSHLHSLVYTHLQHKIQNAERANFIASCRVLVLPLIGCLWATMFSANSLMLILGICATVVAYEGLYRACSAR